MNTSGLKSILDHISTQYINRIKHEFRTYTRGVEDAKVEFLICGTQKAGTTALDAYLRQHPEICMADFKEVHYFDREKYFLYPNPDYSLYHDFFNPKPGQLIWGETTPVYMYWYSAPQRIWEYNPGMKLIIILRNPIERAYSHWNMQRERGVDNLTFLEAINQEEQRRRISLPFQNRRYSYLDRGYYTEQINRLRTYFPADQFLFLKSELIRQDPLDTLSQITHFLGVSDKGDFIQLDLHSRDYEIPLDQKTFEILRNLYELEIEKIEMLTAWDCRDWLALESFYEN